jgi:hypothetical protein
MALVITALERAIFDAAVEMRRSPFGEALQRNHPGRRHSDDEIAVFTLAGIELNHGPPIHRTLWALEASHMGMPIDIEPDRDYIAWVMNALQAVARIAGMCWGAIPVENRIAVMDLDDLGPMHSRYIPGSRGDEGGAALHFESLSNPSPRLALQAMAEAAQATPCFLAARAAQLKLGGSEGLLALQARRDSLGERLAQATQQPMTLDDASEAMTAVLNDDDLDAPESVRLVESTFRAYNQLVNHILWALLGIAEALFDPTVVSEDLGTVRVTADGRSQTAHITLRDRGIAEVGGLSCPFIISGGLPVDGMYLSTTNVFQWGGESFVDLVGDRVAALEAEPGPPSG